MQVKATVTSVYMNILRIRGEIRKLGKIETTWAPGKIETSAPITETRTEPHCLVVQLLTRRNRLTRLLVAFYCRRENRSRRVYYDAEPSGRWIDPPYKFKA